jgi:hypothetical protein
VAGSPQSGIDGGVLCAPRSSDIVERAIKSRSQWLIVISAVVVIALVGGGYWYFWYRPAAERSDAGYAALDRITLPEGWRVTGTAETKLSSGKPRWTRTYIAPNVSAPDALGALSERLRQAGAAPSTIDRCYGLDNCANLVYPPRYRITVNADDRHIVRSDACPQDASCTDVRVVLDGWKPGDPD